MKIKLYEKFLKDNKLELNQDSALEFCDLVEEPNFDAEMLSEEYTDYATKLKSKSARLNNYIKACKIYPDNLVARVLMHDCARSLRDNMIKVNTITSAGYHASMKEDMLFSDYLVDELNAKYKSLIEKGEYSPEDERDMFKLGYEPKQYLWAIKKLYVNFIEQWDIAKASRVGERLLALNPNDDFNILDSLPYLYLYLGMEEEAARTAANRRMDKTEQLLVQAMTELFSEREENALNILKKLNEENHFVLKMIATSYNPKNLISLVHEDNDYSFASYLYVNAMLSGNKLDVLKEFIVKNYNEFE